MGSPWGPAAPPDVLGLSRGHVIGAHMDEQKQLCGKRDIKK